MIRDGHIVLFRFPRTDQASGGFRPAVALRKLPVRYDDWLICMISTQLHQEVPGVDLVVRDNDPDFPASGLRSTSLIRVTRLAIVASETLHGRIGQLSAERLDTVRMRISQWILNGPSSAAGRR